MTRAQEHGLMLPQIPCPKMLTTKVRNHSIFLKTSLGTSGWAVTQSGEVSAIGFRFYQMTFLTFGLVETKRSVCAFQKEFCLGDHKDVRLNAELKITKGNVPVTFQLPTATEVLLC